MRRRKVKLFWKGKLVDIIFVFPRERRTVDTGGVPLRDLAIEVEDEEGDTVIKNKRADTFFIGGYMFTDTFFMYGRVDLPSES